MTLQTLTAPVGWQDGPPDYQSAKNRTWELTGPLRAIVCARTYRGGRVRVWIGALYGGGASEVVMKVEKAHAQFALEAVCGVAFSVSVNNQSKRTT